MACQEFDSAFAWVAKTNADTIFPVTAFVTFHDGAVTDPALNQYSRETLVRTFTDKLR